MKVNKTIYIIVALILGGLGVHKFYADQVGQGIATQLLKYVISTHAHEKWGLNCDYDNNKARHLYHKLGFKEDATIRLYGHQYFHMTLNNK